MEKNLLPTFVKTFKKLSLTFFVGVFVFLVGMVPGKSFGANTNNITLGSNSIPAGNACQGSTKTPIYSFTLTSNITGGNPSAPTFSALSFTTNAGYVASDLTTFQVWYNTTNSLSSATQLTPDITTSLGAGSHSITFASALTISYNSTYYIWITANVSNTATSNNTITVPAITTSNLTVTSTTKNGTATNGNIQTIKPNATIALTSSASTTSQSVCIGNAIIPITYSIGGSGTGAGVTGLPAGVTGAFSGSTLTISGTSTVSGTFNYIVTTSGSSCTNPSLSGTITVNPLPTATISGTTAVCQNSTSPVITFTGAGGTAPYTFTYTLNGVTKTASTTSSSNSLTVSVPTTTTGSFVYALVSVQDASSSACTQAVTGQSATVTVNPLPTASISGTTAVCQNTASPNITFTGAGGTAPYTFTYTIGGATQTVTTPAGNSSVTVAQPTGAAGTFTYSLVSVKDAGTTTCSQAQSGSATITVNPLPTAVITGTTSVCQNNTSPNITFTGANGTAPYTFTYNINGGTNQTIQTSGSSSSVTIAQSTTTVGTYQYNLVSIQGTYCTQVQTGTATITVNPVPTATISGTTAVCQNSSSPNITFTGAGGTVPYTFTYTLNGVTKTASTTSSSNSLTVSVPTTTTGSFVYALVSVQDGSASACTQTITGQSATVTVNPVPTASISGTTAVCLNTASPNITITGAGGTAPYTFTYTIGGGANQTVTTTSGNSVTVPQSTSTAGTYTYSLVSVKDASTTTCTQNLSGPATIATITINPLPTATISGATAVCQNNASPNITFTGANGTAPYTFTYNINGGTNQTATTSGGASSVTVAQPTATTGTFTYNLVSVSGTYCTQAQTGTATITVNPLPTATIGGTVAVCQNDATPTVTFTGTGGTAPYTFTYNINGGATKTVTTGSGANPQSVTVSAPTGTGGTFNYNLVSIQGTNCSQAQTGIATITVNAAPTPTFTTPPSGNVCVNTNVTYTTQASQSNYSWIFPGTSGTDYTVISGGTATDNTVTLQWLATGSKTVTVNYTNSNGCTAVSPASNTITAVAAPSGTLTAAETSGTANNDNTICSGATVTFTATAGYSNYNFKVNGTTVQNETSNTFSSTALTNNTSVTVDVSGTGSCITTFGPVVITVNALPTAGSITGTTNVCIGSTTTLSDATTGGTWSSSNTSRATVDNSGVVTGIAAGTVTITYIVTNANGCTNNTTATVTVNALPTVSGTLMVCAGSTTQLTGSGTAASSNPWTSSNTSVATVNNSGLVTGVAAGTSSITYANNNGCTVSSTVTVNPLPTPTITAGGPTTFCAGGSVTLTSSSATSYQWFNGGTSISGATSSSYTATTGGNYTIKVTNASNCSATSAATTVMVNPLPTITAAATAANVCASGSAQTTTLTYSSIANSPTTYSITWSASPANSFAAISNATLNASPITITVPAGTAAGTYTGTLTVQNVNGCVSSPANSFTVTVNAQPTATISYPNSGYCISGGGTATPTITGYQGGTFSASPTGLSISSTTGIITVNSSNAGVYTVTYTIPAVGACASTTTTTTVSIGAPITNYTVFLQSACTIDINHAAILINPTATVGGGDGSNYSYLWEFSNSGSNFSPSRVVGGNTPSLSIIQTGGDDKNGFYRRTVSSGGCTAITGNSDVHVNIANSLLAATYSITGSNYCSKPGTGATLGLSSSSAPLNGISETYQLFKDGSYTGVSKAGDGTAITFGNNFLAGTYTVQVLVSVAGGATCSPLSLAGSFTVGIDQAVPTVSAGPTQTLCNPASVTLAGSSPSPYTGAWSVVSGSGNFANSSANNTAVSNLATGDNIYKWKVTNGTCRDSSNVTITKNIPNVAPTSLPAAQPICYGSSTTLTQTGGSLGTGAYWQWYTDASFTTSSKVGSQITTANASLTVSPTVTTTYYLRAEGAAGPCITTTPAPGSVTVTVRPLPTATISGGTTVCQGNASPLITFTGTGGTAPYTFTYNINNGSNITVQSPLAGGSNPQTAPVTQITTTAGTFTYNLVSIQGTYCSQPQTGSQTITINPLPTPVITTSGPTTFCSGLSVTLSTGTAASYQWIKDGSIISGATAQNYTASVSGSYSVTVINSFGCPATSASTAVSVTPTVGTPTPITIAGGTEPSCQLSNGSTYTDYTTSATNNTGFNWSLKQYGNNGASIISMSATTARVSYPQGYFGKLDIQVTANGCNSPSAMVIRPVVIAGNVTTPAFTLGATSTRCQGANTVTYAATANNTTGITYTLDGTSAGAGNVIDASSGAVTFTSGWTGTSTITASAAGCAGPKTATHTVTTTASVTTPVFTMGSTSTRCQGAGTVVYTATASNATSITYSLDANSVAAGNAINSANGTVTYVAAWSGTSTITASAAGCNGPLPTMHTVTVTPTVGTPTPITIVGGTEPTCQTQNDGNLKTDYSTSATNNTGFNWSLNQYGNNGASIITLSATTARVSYPQGYSGKLDIQVTANGCNSPSPMVIRTVIINQPFTPVITVTPSPVICAGQSVTLASGGDNTITYSWSNGATTAAITVSPTATTDYTVTANSSGCATQTASQTITVSQLPSITPASATVCFSSSTQTAPLAYSATNSPTTYSITWSASATSAGFQNVTNATLPASPLSIAVPANAPAATYAATITVKNANSCADTSHASFTITVNANTWTGASITSTDWNDGTNWSCGRKPTATENAIIPSAVTKMPSLTQTETINNLTIQTGATVTLAGQIFNINGNVIGGGKFISDAAAAMVLGGTGSGTLNFDATGNNIKDLTVNTTSSNPFTLGSDLYIINSLTLSKGELVSAGHLTIRSTSNAATAYVAPVAYGAKITGDVTVERFIPLRRAFRLLSPSVTTTTSIKYNWMENAVNAGVYPPANNPNPGFGTNITGPNPTANGFDPTITNNPSFFTYNSKDTNQAWVTVPNTSGTLNAGDAYRLLIRGSRSTDMSDPSNFPTPTNTTLRATGTLFTGNYSVSNLSTRLNGYTFVGNPYASPIDFEYILKNSSTNIAPLYIAYDPYLNARGGFVFCYPGSPTITVPTDPNLNKNIQSGQAFFVQTAGSSPSLQFSEASKSIGNSNVFRVANTSTRLSVNLLLNSTEGVQNTADGVMAVFDDNFSNRIGNKDSYKISNQDENVAINHSDTLLSIEGRPAVTNDDTIHLKMWQFRQKEYILRLKGTNFSPSVTAYVRDSYLKSDTAVDLASGSDYHFAINSDSASFASNRFMIVFKSTSVLPVTLTHIKAYTKDKGIQVDWTAETEINIGKYEVEKSVDGEHFGSAASIRVKANNGVTQNYGWFDDSASIGNNYYRIKVTELSGAVKYSEIVVVNISGGKSNITIYPNPVKGNTIAVHMNNMKKGRYIVNLYNGLGQKLHSSIIEHNGGNATYQVMTRNLISKGAYRLHITDGESQMTETVLFE